MHRNRRPRIFHRAKGLNSFKKDRKVKRGNAIETSSKIESEKSPGH